MLKTIALASLLALALAGPAAAQDAAAPDPQARFLAENAKKEGWTVNPSGLQYKVTKKAPFGAKSPKSSDTVRVHYEGRLIDGTVFDSSYKRGEPATFPLNRVIPGWTEGVSAMKVGEVRELAIPASLGYGDRGAGNMIPPGATLLFTVELLDIVQPQ